MPKNLFRCAAIVALFLAGAAASLSQGSPARTASAPATAPAHRWIGPDGAPLPWQSDDEALEFLRKAHIGKTSGTGRGITQPRKVDLELNGVRAHAIFHDIHEEKRIMELRGGQRILNFKDSYLFQMAAYELARMVGLDNVPPSVKRSLAGKTGSMTLWLEGMITDEMRQAQKREPEGLKKVRWSFQMHIMHFWDALIYNFDRNQGNILIDNDWNVWLIDHTRSFLKSDDIPKLDRITTCERRLFERVKALDKKAVTEHLKAYLNPAEIDYLFKRRDKLVAYIQQQVRQRGEAAVFFTYP